MIEYQSKKLHVSNLPVWRMGPDLFDRIREDYAERNHPPKVAYLPEGMEYEYPVRMIQVQAHTLPALQTNSYRWMPNRDVSLSRKEAKGRTRDFSEYPAHTIYDFMVKPDVSEVVVTMCLYQNKNTELLLLYQKVPDARHKEYAPKPFFQATFGGLKNKLHTQELILLPSYVYTKEFNEFFAVLPKSAQRILISFSGYVHAEITKMLLSEKYNLIDYISEEDGMAKPLGLRRKSKISSGSLIKRHSPPKKKIRA